MSSSYISKELRKQIYDRAQGFCEYCLAPAQLSLISFPIDHIIAEKHGGETKSENLALSCPLCNRYKGSDIASIDPKTRQLSAFYNPRKDKWIEHFSLTDAALLPLSSKGRVTEKILRLNQPERIKERRLFAQAGFLKAPEQ